jgi:glycerol transport system ATP-binding protein
MKWQLRSQLKLVHKQFGHTMVYVTHDQTEALTFADTVVVMYGGEIVQIGTPQELFEKPSHTFVGYFIGSPGMNVLPVTPDGTGVRLGATLLDLGMPVAASAGEKIELGVRPEFVRIGRQGMAASVTKVEDVGRQKIVRFAVEGREVVAVLKEDETVPAEPRISFAPEGINIYADSWRVGGAAR